MSPAPLLFSHPASLAHDTGSHPESAARMTAIEQALSAVNWCDYAQVQSPPASLEALRAVHPGRYVDAIREIAESGGGRIDADTVISPGSFGAARRAAGGAVALVEAVLGGQAPTGISIHRPPGHHAEPDRPMGFCLFNNVAVAARFAIEELDLERVMIVDYDVHHGNGTNAVFHADPRVLYLSVHQSPLYPGTGPLGDVGSGEGEGFCVNLPVAPESGNATFTGMIDGVAVPLARAFAPQLVLISAGFDAAAADPLAECTVTAEGFAAMTASLRAVGVELGVPVVAVLEGGYSLTALPAGVTAAMRALAGEGTPAPVPGEWRPEVEQARTFLARWWPVLREPAAA